MICFKPDQGVGRCFIDRVESVASSSTMKPAKAENASSAEEQLSEDQFPFKLHRLLEDAETHGFTDAISWSKDGKSFLVLNKHKLEHEIMPCYFSSAKFKSFQRSLNLWGFACDKKRYQGPGTLRYHSFFVRGCPKLCHGMQRTRVKQPGTRNQSPVPPARRGSSKAATPKSAEAALSQAPAPPASSSAAPGPGSLSSASAQAIPNDALQALAKASAEVTALARHQAMAQQQHMALLQVQELAALSAHTAALRDNNSTNGSLPSFLAAALQNNNHNNHNQNNDQQVLLLKQLVAARLRDLQGAVQASLQQQIMSAYR